jgi:DNA-binding MurR/RpiR family transcriptional regulator
MAVQGKAFSETELQRIVYLLRTTEMTISDIAQRMGCSRSAIASINRRFQIREYSGLRSVWKYSLQERELENIEV